MADNHAQMIQEEVASAPKLFQEAYALVVEGNLKGATSALSNTIDELTATDPAWVGSAHCLMAFCLERADLHGQAIQSATMGLMCGLNPVGWLYYHDVMGMSLDEADDLKGALSAAEEAIAYFEQQEAFLWKAEHLLRKSGILKQIASRVSCDPSRNEDAKEPIMNAIRSVFAGFEICADNWEEVRKELSYLRNIAARAGVTADELKFLHESEKTSHIAREVFDLDGFERQAATELSNLAVKAIEGGQRERAVDLNRAALRRALEATPSDRSFKAILAYSHGVGLLRLHGLDDPSRLSSGDETLRNAAGEIREVWGLALRLYETLDPVDISDCDERLPPGISDAVSRIRNDPLMASTG